MSKKKSPYLSLTEEEVKIMESNYLLLQLGGDFIGQDGYYLFTHSEMTRLYRSTLKDLMGIIRNGNEKDRRYALDLIGGLIVQPMRLH